MADAHVNRYQHTHAHEHCDRDAYLDADGDRRTNKHTDCLRHRGADTNPHGYVRLRSDANSNGYANTDSHTDRSSNQRQDRGADHFGRHEHPRR